MEIRRFVPREEAALSRLAARTLLDKGFQRIGGVFKRDDVQGHERFRGVSEMLLQAGQDFPDDRICWFGTESRHRLFQEADGHSAARRPGRDRMLQ